MSKSLSTVLHYHVELTLQCAFCYPSQDCGIMMHFKRPLRENRVTANILPTGPNECEVPMDTAYPVCAEKVEVRNWKYMWLHLMQFTTV